MLKACKLQKTFILKEKAGFFKKKKKIINAMRDINLEIKRAT